MDMMLIRLSVLLKKSDVPGIPDIGAKNIVEGLLETAYWAAGVLAVVSIILGGVFYMISNGAPQKITRSKDIIMYGVIGLAVTLLAFVVTNFIVGWFV